MLRWAWLVRRGHINLKFLSGGSNPFLNFSTVCFGSLPHARTGFSLCMKIRVFA